MGIKCCENVESEKSNSSKAAPVPTVVNKDEPIDREMEDRINSLIKYQEAMDQDFRNISLTKSVLTKDMAYEMINMRTNTGEGLGMCIYVNVNNHSALYPYAVSPDCYNTFADFFGAVIEKIHGVPQHYSHLRVEFGAKSHGNLIDLNNTERLRDRVIYTEMCIRRNLQDTPFTPRMSSAGRKDVINEVEPKLRALFEPYDEMVWMPAEWEERMEYIKNELDDIGAMKDYPNERQNIAFMTPDNIAVGCVFNFDDHLQYIVSTNDGRLGECIAELSNILSDESMEKLEYSAHPTFGHLTVNPAHVGTGFIIRLIVKLPFVSRLGDLGNSIVKEFDVTIRSVLPNQNIGKSKHLEHPGIVVLFNNKTLNKSEIDIIKDIVRAFTKLSLLESELELTTPMSAQMDNMGVENLYTLREKIMNNDGRTYTKKYFTNTIFNSYSRTETRFGTKFMQCIRHNAFHPRSLFPRAGDKDCYYKFQNFFNPIILETNRVKTFEHAQKPKYGSPLAEGGKQFQMCHPNLLSYRIRFRRNLFNFPFPNMMSDQDRKDVEYIMCKIFEELPVELEGEYIPISDLKCSTFREEILENHLIKPPNEVSVSAGFYRDWPRHRGIFLSKPHPDFPSCILLAVIVNVEDHVQVVVVDCSGLTLGLAYERALQMIRMLDLRLELQWAKRNGYGFLCSSPESVGCGLRVSALIHLPMLGNKREIMETKCRDLNLIYRGSSGSGTPAAKMIFDVCFRPNLNVTEIYALTIFAQHLKELILCEHQLNFRYPLPKSGDECFERSVSISSSLNTEFSSTEDEVNISKEASDAKEAVKTDTSVENTNNFIFQISESNEYI